MTRFQVKSIGNAVLRVGAGFLFFVHGAQKLFGWFGGFGPEHGTVPLFTQLGAAGAIEVVGGVLLILGLFVRPVAAIMAAEMAVAYVQVHAGRGDWQWWTNGGELALLFALIFVYFALNGAGAYSIDSQRIRGRIARTMDRVEEPVVVETITG